MKSGQRSYVPGIGYIAIISVDPVELTGLTDDDAALDGFPSADLLREEICTMYADNTTKNYTPFKVRFSVYPPEKQQGFTEERQRMKQLMRQQQSIQQECRKKSLYVQQQEYVTQTLEKLRKMSEAG